MRAGYQGYSSDYVAPAYTFTAAAGVVNLKQFHNELAQFHQQFSGNSINNNEGLAKKFTRAVNGISNFWSTLGDANYYILYKDTVIN